MLNDILSPEFREEEPKFFYQEFYLSINAGEQMGGKMSYVLKNPCCLLSGVEYGGIC